MLLLTAALVRRESGPSPSLFARLRALAVGLALATALPACTSDAPDVAPAPANPGLEASWVARIVKDPTAFESTIAQERTGWIALHKNAWTDAAAGTGAPAKRAAGELAVLQGLLAGISNDTWRSLGVTWERRGTLPTDSVLPGLVALAAKDAGDQVSWARWLKMPGRSDPALDARVARHEAIRKGEGGVSDALALAAAPVVEELVTDGRRVFWDPMLHLTIAMAWGRTIADGYPDDPLQRTLFSGMIDPSDGSPAASLARLGLSLPASDDVEACRDTARAFDQQLLAWAPSLEASAPPEGAALLRDLRLVDGLRSRALVDWSGDLLEAGKPRCALALAELALDHEHPREITPLNPPTVYALLAAANLRTGHTREALDALEVLVGAYPEAAGLDETVGDLAVLEGLDRTGDSREN